MGLHQKVRCIHGYIHTVFAVGEVMEPYQCGGNHKISGTYLQREKKVVEYQKSTNASTRKKK